MPTAPLTSARLAYRPLAADCLADFHQLIVDPHIRRYLLDGETMDLPWCVDQQRASDDLFRSQGVGLWMVELPRVDPPAAIGFCGFVRFAETGPHPQLTYAFFERHTGMGYATEAARALIDYAAANTTLGEIHSAVDEPNAASVRVLDKLGFVQSGSTPGAFGRILQFRLPLKAN